MSKTGSSQQGGGGPKETEALAAKCRSDSTRRGQSFAPRDARVGG